jgi:hypothetical protein
MLSRARSLRLSARAASTRVPALARTAVGRVGAWEAGAAWCGVLLVISLFFDWYGVRVLGPLGQHGARGPIYSGQVSGWNSLHAVRFLLLALALVGAGCVLLRAAGRLSEQPAWRLLVAGSGALAALLIIWRLAQPPIHQASLPGSFALQVTLHVGGFVALVAAIGMAIAAWRAAGAASGA